MVRQPRRSRRIDGNQRMIVAALRSTPGVSVMTDMDDILVGYKGKNYLFELKTPDQRKNDGEWKAGALKKSQLDLLESWAGQYDAVSSLDEILELIGVS